MYHQIQSRRFYYTEHQKFEQSLDVWEPKDHDGNGNDDADNVKNKKSPRNMPVVVLVVGSGWLGHRNFIYAPTSWWNSSGAKNFARLGYTCVCVRHRGAFPFGGGGGIFTDTGTTTGSGSGIDSNDNGPMLGKNAVLASFVASVAYFLVTGNDDHADILTVAIATVLVLVLSWVVLVQAASGSASIEHMMEDVSDALAWVHNPENNSILGLHAPKHTDINIDTDTDTNNIDTDTHDDVSKRNGYDKKNGNHNHNHDGSKKTTKLRSRPLFFGGYSSGSHVAASLLQRPDLLASRGLFKDQDADGSYAGGGGAKSSNMGARVRMEQICDGVVMVSGLLAVRSSPLVVSSAPSESQSQSKLGLESKSAAAATKSATNDTVLPSDDLPRWLTDAVMKTVFGNEVDNIPSPLHGSPSMIPRLPHLLIGCKHEVFGINWLDVFFCSGDFCTMLKSRGIRAKFVEVASDHWNILNSGVFLRALETELDWLLAPHDYGEGDIDDIDDIDTVDR